MLNLQHIQAPLKIAIIDARMGLWSASTPFVIETLDAGMIPPVVQAYCAWIDAKQAGAGKVADDR